MGVGGIDARGYGEVGYAGWWDFGNVFLEGYIYGDLVVFICGFVRKYYEFWLRSWGEEILKLDISGRGELV